MLPLLRGLRVLDLTRLHTQATCKLADLGADVIKIEEPPLGDYLRGLEPIVDDVGVGLGYLQLNRNKRSLGLNLKSDAGRAIFFELLETADVVMELSKPGAFARVGLDYESLRARKPDLVYCSLTGYGQTGPYRSLPSHGMNIDAAAGLIRTRPGPGGKPEVAPFGATLGLAVEEGALHAALAVVAALVQRANTGKGQYLDVSSWEGALSYNQRFLAALNLGGGDRAIAASGEGGQGPRYDVYGTKDDRAIFLCPLEKKFWESFCEIVGRPEWADRGTWLERMDFGNDDPTLAADIESVMRTRTLDEWITVFAAAGVPASPVLDPDDLVDDAHVEARRMVVTSDDLRYAGVRWVRPPISVPESEYTVAIPPPVLGEHTDEILQELGYDEVRRAELTTAGVVVAASREGVVR